MGNQPVALADASLSWWHRRHPSQKAGSHEQHVPEKRAVDEEPPRIQDFLSAVMLSMTAPLILPSIPLVTLLNNQVSYSDDLEFLSVCIHLRNKQVSSATSML